MKHSIRNIRVPALAGMSLGLLLMAVSANAATQSTPFVPAADDVVLAEVNPASGREAEFRGEQRDALSHPHDLSIALKFARAAIRQGSEESDPRYFGYAQSALSAWWASSNPPAEARLLRATILQWQHQFSASRRDLDALIAADGAGVNQAHLIRATVELVQGEPAAARHDCVTLIDHVETLIAATCIASVNALTGDPAAVARALSFAIDGARGASPAAQVWARTELAEIYARQGDALRAQSAFEAALEGTRQSGVRDPYLLAAYADFLLDQGQARKVVDLLAGLSRIDNLLLRLALAESMLASKGEAGLRASAQRHSDELERRFAETRERGDGVHQREEAIYLLKLRGESGRALDVARDNWQKQRELIDARVLLEAAAAAGRPDAAREVAEWLRANGVHDRRLEASVKSAGLA
ncbi:MAG TPA: hypothetical protein VGI93_14965 [Steroidobacteraceae bacterium]|jgi:hypothetical protein